MKTFLAVLATLLSFNAHAIITAADRQDIPVPRNLLAGKNPGFESGLLAGGWVMSQTGTVTRVTSGGNQIAGGTAVFDATAASQTFTASCRPVGEIASGSGEASMSFKGAAVDYKLQVTDGTNVLAERVIPALTAAREVGLTFLTPSSGNVCLRVISGSDAVALSMDDAYLGRFKTVDIGQASFFGSAQYAVTTNCVWSTASTSFAAYAADADCPVPTVAGNASAPATKIPGITFSNLPAGDYLISVVGQFDLQTSGVSATALFELYDGTSSTGTALARAMTGGTSNISGSSTMVGRLSYLTAQSNVTFQIRGKTTSASNPAELYNAVAGSANPFTFTVHRFPTSSETATRIDSLAWRVDANISGANPSLGTAAQTAYIGVEDAGLTLTNNSGSGTVAAQIPCSSTNAPTGTTCAAGNESVGVSFTAPVAGDVLACASFSVNHGASVSNTPVAFQIVETAANAQTILQQGKSRIPVGGGSSNPGAGGRICGTFSFASAGQKTLRLMYEQLAQVVAPVMLADADVNVGQRDIHWEVYPLNYLAGAMAVFQGMVTNSTSGKIRTEVARISASASSCAVISQVGSWLTGACTSPSTGQYRYTVVASAFSATPICQITKGVHNSQDRVMWSDHGSTSTSTIATVTGAGSSGMATLANDNSGEYNLSCTGAY